MDANQPAGIPATPQWAEQALWWHVYPLGVDGRDVHGPHVPAGPGEGLRRLTRYLDHVAELGFTGVALGPIFASVAHGYDTLDYTAIDPRLGTEQDFADFVQTCHARGLKVMLDGVFNHVARTHPWALRALAEGPQGEYADWFRIDWDAPGGPAFADFEGHASLVALNHANPAVRGHIANVMSRWLDAPGRPGADAWRLDAAYTVPADFWADVLARVRAEHPEVWFVAEMIHGDYADYAARASLHAVTQYELWKAIWSSLATENFFELDWTLGRHQELLAAMTPMTFVSNHDVTRIVSQVGADRALAALAILLVVGGVPSIYYGDEVGWAGIKEERRGGDDAIRPALPADPADLRNAGEAAERFLRGHRELLALRRERPWLARSRTEVRDLANTHVTLVSREEAGPGVVSLTLDLEPTGGVRFAMHDGEGRVLAAG